MKCAAATLQMLTRGRAVLAIGRGDSAAHFIGRQPDRLASFERTLSKLRTYLDQGSVDRDGVESRIQWLPLTAEFGRVPIELVPSGPRMARIAATYADRISFAIGSDPRYVAEFLEMTRKFAAEAGRDPSSLHFGAWVNVVMNEDKRTALDAVRGTTGIWARFSLMRPDRDSLPRPLREALGMLDGYDMDQFGQASATDASIMPDDFVDWFAIAGNESHVADRLAELKRIGLDYLYVVPGELGFSDPVGQQSIEGVARLIPDLAE